MTECNMTADERACPNGCGPLEPYASADIGVGVQDFGPWGCPACHWVEGTEEDQRVAQSVSDFLEHTEKHGLLSERQLQAATEGESVSETTNYGGVDLTLHPILKAAHRVACLIEKCGASPALTRASCAAFDLLTPLQVLVLQYKDEQDKNAWLRAELDKAVKHG